MLSCFSSLSAETLRALASLSWSASDLSPSLLSASQPACSACRCRSRSASFSCAAVTWAWRVSTEPSALPTLAALLACCFWRSALLLLILATAFFSPSAPSCACCHPAVAWTRALESSAASCSARRISSPISSFFDWWRAAMSCSFSSMAACMSSHAWSWLALSCCMRSISSADCCVTSSARAKSAATTKRSSLSFSALPALQVMYCARSLRSFSSDGVMSSLRIFWISSTLACFFSMVFIAASFLLSYILVPAASAISPRISCGLMLITFVMRPCMMRK
mmetsp:Transcript_6733/g.15729  ORF Transcript_6733/g.15729 Transcript_6733/m.15729 type:complete len:280 (+) Transcript_6733:2448-3287(+)